MRIVPTNKCSKNVNDESTRYLPLNFSVFVDNKKLGFHLKLNT